MQAVWISYMSFLHSSLGRLWPLYFIMKLSICFVYSGVYATFLDWNMFISYANYGIFYLSIYEKPDPLFSRTQIESYYLKHNFDFIFIINFIHRISIL